MKDVFGELRQLMAELALISHTSAVNHDKSARDTSEDIGGRRPPGGDREHPNRSDPDELDAFKSSYHRRTVDYFEKEMDRLVKEARDTLSAWKRTPIPDGQPPEFGSSQWKRWVAESLLDNGELARLFNVSRQYIHQVRKAYGRVS